MRRRESRGTDAVTPIVPGIYGSTLRHHAGRFWFVTTNVSDFASGQVVVHADDPAGPWSEPVLVHDAIGIDPDLCWDADGQCYNTWNALSFTYGEQGIRQAPLDLTTGELTGPSYAVWQGSGLAAAEGPHLYRIEDYWYLLLAEGGTERGHCVTVARGRTPQGPFEPCPRNPVFTESALHGVRVSAGPARVRASESGVRKGAVANRGADGRRALARQSVRRRRVTRDLPP